MGANNVIVIATSPTTGTKMPTSGRMHMNYKSPLTDAYGSTNGGGRFGVDIKNEHGAMYLTKLKLDAGKFTKKETSFGILPSMGSLGILGMVDNYNQLIHNNMRDIAHREEDISKISGEALRYHYQNARPGEKKSG